ncbi:uncharacterized protein LOC131079097 [Cryptomeria japonica]|uniref:uncharacterized protein LOC131079097 n=1 Tax=Cryptomeria japonica TaxID=3369 RepID=UPI0025ABE4F8|nr:uncharacterized protein LOC131079097 [Cryptomeria japonica]
MDNAMCFRSEEFIDFCKSYGIRIFYASSYHPQGSGQAKASNKGIMKIIRRTLEKNKKAWASNFKMVVWANKITIKKAIGKSPFELVVYGTQVRLPVNNLLLVYRFIPENGMDMSEPRNERIDQIIELDEVRDEAHRKNLKLQHKRKYLFDKKASNMKFD